MASVISKLHPLQQYACTNCKTRKKRCDRKLPNCGSCTKRSVACRYVVASSGQDECNISVKRIPLGLLGGIAASLIPAHPLSTPLQALELDSKEPFRQPIYPAIKPSLMLMHSFSNSPLSDYLKCGNSIELNSFDGTIHLQVYRIIQAYSQYVDDISVQFFGGVHHWMPILSRKRFHENLMNYRNPPRADFSVLLLAVCLITIHPRQNHLDQFADHKTLYLTTKMILAHVQAITPPTINLVQASLLICAYEYAQRFLEAAYITMGSCIRLAISIGLDRFESALDHKDFETTLRKEEERNLWWGIIIFERVLSCESALSGRPRATEFPSRIERVPSEIDLLDRSEGASESGISDIPVSENTTEGVGCFGREAQIAYLLDQVLQTVKLSDVDEKQAQFATIDRELRAFLNILFEQCEGTWGMYCASVAIGISALFVLHRHILSLIPTVPLFESWQKSSWSALNTLTKMVIDVAYSIDSTLRNPSVPRSSCLANGLAVCSIDTLPPMSPHVARAALEHHALVRDSEDPTWLEEERILRIMVKHFEERWLSVEL